MQLLGRVIVGALGVAWLLAAAPVRAADVEDPEALIQQANELRRKGDNARAYGYLKRAYEIAHTARSAAQLGLVEHALGRWADAEVHLGEALATSDPWVAENRPRLESSRSVVRSKLGRVEVAGAPAGATVSVGNDPAIKLPPDRILYLAAGERTLRVEAPDVSPVTKTVTVAVGETATVTVEMARKEIAASPGAGAGTAAAGEASGGAGPAAESAAPPATREATSGRGLRIAGLGIAGGGLALGVAGFFVRGAATTKLDAIANDARNGVPYNESNGNWQDLERAGVAMLATGGAMVVAGTILYLVNRTSSESSSVALAYVPAIGGGGLTLAGRF
jgi:hypothetical protein